jgi:hypothetical protein
MVEEENDVPYNVADAAAALVPTRFITHITFYMYCNRSQVILLQY